MKPSLAALLVATLSAPAVRAEIPALLGTTSVGVGVGGQRYDGSYGNNTMPYYRALASYHFSEDFAIRAVGGYGNISDGTHRFRTEWFSNIGAQMVLQPRIEVLENIRPYLATGVSTDFGTVKHDGARVFDLDWNAYWPVEIGIDLVVSRNLMLNAFLENRVVSRQWDKLDGIRTGGDYYERRDELPRAGVGITLLIGSPRPEPVPTTVVYSPVVVKVVAPPPPPPARVDSDKDGVFDSVDRCPNTPAGTTVDIRGCPLDSDKDGVSDNLDRCPNTTDGIAVDAYGCPLDSDKDGVPNTLDKCPNTLPGTTVDATGCPPDFDKDGVPDAFDKCPNTPNGTRVDSTGCLLIKFVPGTKLVLDGIVFETGKSKVDPISAPVLQHAAAAIKKAPKARIEISGYTDNVGSAAMNKRLSQQRAQSVKTYLMQLGVPSWQLTAKGYGPSEPVADNTMEEGRSQNRRIEFHIK